MNKNILIYCPILIALIILVSITSVIGNQNVKSNPVLISPLFGVRTNRAINNEQNAVKSNNIGKGREINILLPKITHLKNTEYSLYTVTCGAATTNPLCCVTMYYWACTPTAGPICQYITTGPICQFWTFDSYSTELLNEFY